MTTTKSTFQWCHELCPTHNRYCSYHTGNHPANDSHWALPPCECRWNTTPPDQPLTLF